LPHHFCEAWGTPGNCLEVTPNYDRPVAVPTKFLCIRIAIVLGAKEKIV
jgi:hypothetical protein